MNFQQQLQQKIDTRTKPIGSLGVLERLAFKIGSIQKTLTPELKNPAMIVFAADHGIEREGVSPCPREMTWQMVLNFLRGGAGINVFCKQHGFNLTVVDVGVDYDFAEGLNVAREKIARGTENILHAPAMSIETCLKAMEVGAKYVRMEHERGCNVIGFGEMGIANTSPASLLLHHFTGAPLEICVGPGAGLDAKGVEHKLNILKRAYAKHKVSTPLEALATYGGLEIAAIAGAVLEAKRLGMVIIADGFITSSGFLAAFEIDHSIIDNVIFSHASKEQGHQVMLAHMKGEPVLRLDLRLGEGTGAAIAYPIIQSALVFLNNMASFDEAEVYEVERYRETPENLRS